MTGKTDDPSMSTSQEIQGAAIDMGEESFSVDIMRATVKEGEPGPGAEGAKAKAEGTEAKGAKAEGTKAEGTEAEGTKAEGTEAKGAKAEGTEAKGAKAEAEEINTDKVPAGVKKKLDKYTAARRNAEREAGLLREENEQLKAKIAGADASSKNSKPESRDFETDAEFIEALTDYKANKAISDKEVADLQKETTALEGRQVALAKEKHDAIVSVINTGKEKYKDFDTVFNDKIKVTEPMADAIALLDNGSDVAYFLGKNPQRATEIAQMGVVEAAMAIQDISSGARKSANAVQASNASDPIKPGSGSSANVKTLENMNQGEYNAEMNRRDKVKRGG